LLHKFPSEVRAQPTDELMTMMMVLGQYKESYRPNAHHSDGDMSDLSDFGVT
jgi:hypothetical protein